MRKHILGLLFLAQLAQELFVPDGFPFVVMVMHDLELADSAFFTQLTDEPKIISEGLPFPLARRRLKSNGHRRIQQIVIQLQTSNL